VQPAQRKSSQQATGATATAEQKPAEQPPTTTTQQPQGQTKQAPSSIGTIVDVIDKGHGAIVKLSTGFQAGTGDQTTIASAKSLRESGRRVELLTKAASKPGFAPTITDIDLLTDEGSQA
jgi:ATP-dependent 26S proteasome regulatory subunit